MTARSTSQRVADFRRRIREGVEIYHLELPDAVVEATIESGLLSEREALDKAKVGEACVAVLREWARRILL